MFELEPFFSAFEKLFVEFSWRRALYVMLIIGVTVSVLFLAEWYTGYLRLGRLQRSAEILTRLQDIETKAAVSSPRVRQIEAELLGELAATTYPREIAFQIPRTVPMSTTQRVWAFVAGAAPWIFVTCFGFANARRGEPAAWTAVFMLLVIAGLFGWFGSLLPQLLWPWAQLIIYPVGQIIIVGGIGAIIALRASRRAKPEAAAEV
jgi:hypothetical protein